MSQTKGLTAAKVIELVTLALNVLWSLHLEIQGHPCNYRPVAEKGVNGLIELMRLAQEGEKHEPHTLPPDQRIDVMLPL